MLIMIKIVHWSQNKKKKFNKLVDERYDEITKLDKKVTLNDLRYKYKGPTADVKLDEFDNTLDLLDKIREREISLTDAKNDQAQFKLNLSEIKRFNKKHMPKEKKIHCIILKCFTKQEAMLLNFWIIILQWYLKQNIKQLKEQDLKY